MIQDFYTIGPTDTPKSLVFFLHGYGGNAENVRSLALYWAHTLPHTLFIIPNAPTAHSYDGYEWFPLPDLTTEIIKKGIAHISPMLTTFIKQQQKKYHLGRDKTIIAGFSQGALITLALGLFNPQLAKGLIAYAGGLFIDDEWLSLSPQDTSVLLIHGTDDVVVPSHLAENTHAFLERHGLSSQLHLIPGLEHSIDPQGLDIGAAFIKSIITPDQA